MLNQDALKARLGLDAADIASIQNLQHKLWKVLRENYAIAAISCVAGDAFCPVVPGQSDLRRDAEALSAAGISSRYKPWLDDASLFHRIYLNELLRSAALFPRVTSEVETFNDNELTGWTLHDRQFLLSFDDGPTRGRAGEGADGQDTDKTLEMLRRYHVNGVFFALGDAFEARLRDSSVEAMNRLYSGMCVGSHGWEHKPHTLWPQWQSRLHRVRS